MVSGFKGKPADHFTHALKVLGDGNMVDGALRIFAIYDKKVKKAKLTYGLGGLAISAAGFGIPRLISKHKQNLENQKLEEQEVLSVLENELALADEESERETANTEG